METASCAALRRLRKISSAKLCVSPKIYKLLKGPMYKKFAKRLLKEPFGEFK